MSADTADKPAAKFGGLSPSEAGKRRWEVKRQRDAEAAEQAKSGARPKTAPGGSPLDALRAQLAEDPEKYARGLAGLIERGDPRSLSLMAQLFREEADVKVPRAERLVRELDRDARRALLLYLEARGAPSGADIEHVLRAAHLGAPDAPAVGDEDVPAQALEDTRVPDPSP